MKWLTKSNLIYIALFALVSFHLINNFYWEKINLSPMAWDPANHTTIAIQMKKCLLSGGGVDGLGNCLRLTPFYPPLVHIIVAAALMVFGTNLAIAQFANTVFFAASLIAIFLWASEFYKSKGVGLLAAVLASLVPPLYDASRFLWLDIPLVGMVFLTWYLLLKSDNFSKRIFTYAAFISLGFGMLTKWNIVVFLLVPFVITFIRSVKVNGFIVTCLRIMLGIVISALIFSPWLALNLQGFLYYSRAYTLPDFSEPQKIWSLENIFWYLRMVINYGFLFWFSIVALAGTISYVVKAKFENKTYSIITVIFIYVAFTLIGNKDIRYMYTVMALIASVTAYSLYKLYSSKKLLGIVLGGLLVSLLIFQYYLLSYRKSFQTDVERTAVIPGIGHISYLNITDYPVQAADKNYWPNNEIIADINNLTQGEDTELLVLAEYPKLNSTNLKMLTEAQSLNHITINSQFPPFEDKAGFGTSDWLKNYLLSKDYILVSENESSQDSYLFRDLLDKIQPMLLDENQDIALKVKDYTLPYEEISMNLRAARIPTFQGVRYEYCATHKCDKLYLYKTVRSKEIFGGGYSIVEVKNNVPEACGSNVCDLSFTVPTKGWVRLSGATMAYKGISWNYDTSKGQGAIWMFINEGSEDVNISMKAWNQGNGLKVIKSTETPFNYNNIITDLKTGISELKQTGNCTGTGCTTVGYTVWNCTGNNECSVQYSYDPVGALLNSSLTEQQKFIPYHTSVIQ